MITWTSIKLWLKSQIPQVFRYFYQNGKRTLYATFINILHKLLKQRVGRPHCQSLEYKSI